MAAVTPLWPSGPADYHACRAQSAGRRALLMVIDGKGRRASGASGWLDRWRLAVGIDPSDVESLEPPDGGAGLSATVERGTAGVRVVLDGELDYATAPRLREVVAGLNSARAQEVELDLTGLTFLALQGVRMLVEVR